MNRLKMSDSDVPDKLLEGFYTSRSKLPLAQYIVEQYSAYKAANAGSEALSLHVWLLTQAEQGGKL